MAPSGCSRYRITGLVSMRPIIRVFLRPLSVCMADKRPASDLAWHFAKRPSSRLVVASGSNPQAEVQPSVLPCQPRIEPALLGTAARNPLLLSSGKSASYMIMPRAVTGINAGIGDVILDRRRRDNRPSTLILSQLYSSSSPQVRHETYVGRMISPLSFDPRGNVMGKVVLL